jgi:alkyl hydroperoxide reductase subunit AhpC
MFSTPFYTGNKWMIYLSKQKNEGLELCFVQAKHFVQHKEWLDFKKRKQVAGITFHYIGDINEEVVDLLITEALRVDKLLPQAKTTQKTR